QRIPQSRLNGRIARSDKRIPAHRALEAPSGAALLVAVARLPADTLALSIRCGRVAPAGATTRGRPYNVQTAKRRPCGRCEILPVIIFQPFRVAAWRDDDP